MKKFINAKGFLSAVIAAAMLFAASTALGGCASGADNALSDQLEYASGKVKAFASGQAAREFTFADEIYSKASLAALSFTSKTTAEDLQTIARYLSVDSITVTDGKGLCVASYPEGEEGQKIQDIEDKKIFNKVVKGISVKLMSEPVPVDDTDQYSLFAAVTRTDDAGAVIIGLTTAQYAAVTGESLAEKCGVNTVIAEGGSVISSTLTGVEASQKLTDIGINDDNIAKGEFSVTIENKTYTCKSVKHGDYTLICAVAV